MADRGTPGPVPRVFLASRNPKKLDELRRILSGELGDEVEVLGLDDVASYPEPVEDAPDFDGNALLKARAGLAATGLPSLADDSGLCVDALNGMPGVLSARWSGLPKDDDRNNRLLLEQLRDTPDERRGGHFHASIAFVRATGLDVPAEDVVGGDMPGRVIGETRGENGFGYDAVFVPDDQDAQQTSAEMSAEDKDAVSHRGRALRAIAPLVVEALTAR